MSRQITQRQLIEQEHDEWYAWERLELNSPVINYIEQFYTRKLREGRLTAAEVWEKLLGLDGRFPMALRRHMFRHIRIDAEPMLKAQPVQIEEKPKRPVAKKPAKKPAPQAERERIAKARAEARRQRELAAKEAEREIAAAMQQLFKEERGRITPERERKIRERIAQAAKRALKAISKLSRLRRKGLSYYAYSFGGKRG